MTRFLLFLTICITAVPTAGAGEPDQPVSPLWLYLPAGLGVGYLMAEGDRDIAHFFHNHRDTGIEDVGKTLTRSGDGKVILGVVGLTYGIGYFSEDSKMKETATLGAESLVISGVITETLKHGTGRQRPNYADGEDRWNGPRYFFRLDDKSFDSFPSGHATAAFALATTLAMHYPDGWVPPIAYTWAVGVTISRIYNEVHWTSDVLVGSAIGYFTARAVSYYHQRTGGGIILIPRIISIEGTNTLGLTLSLPLP